MSSKPYDSRSGRGGDGRDRDSGRERDERRNDYGQGSKHYRGSSRDGRDQQQYRSREQGDARNVDRGTARGSERPYDARYDAKQRDGRRRSRSRTPPPRDTGRQPAGTPPGKSGTPGPAPAPAPAAVRPGANNAVLAELIRQAKAKQQLEAGRQAAGSGSGSDGEGLEAGEIAPDDGHTRKRKHSPIVWNLAPKGAAEPRSGSAASPGPYSDEAHDDDGARPAKRAAPTTLLDRAAEEIAAFRQRRQEIDYDPDAPAAMKSSPSVSGEDDAYGDGGAFGGDAGVRSGGGEGGGGGPLSSDEEGYGDEDEDGGGGPAAARGGGGSRWQQDTAEEEVLGRGGYGPGDSASDDDQRAGGSGFDSPGPDSPGGPRASMPPDPTDLRSPEMQPGPLVPEASPLRMSRHVMALAECRSVEEYERLNRISEGTYGVVFRAREKSTGTICALKKIKMEKERDGFPVTSIREINILLNLHHPNIVNVSEVVMGSNLNAIFMVMEFCDHDLKCLMNDKSAMARPFSVAETKCLMRQLLSGIAYLHDNWVVHRDLKTSNILYTNDGQLKICDFGLARQFGSPLKPYTQPVVTLWYRAPELLLGETLYSTAIDMWSVGCIMAELLTGKPLFDGQSEIEQLDKIVSVMGTPNEEVWPDIRKLPHWGKFQLRQMPSQLRSRFSSAFGSGATLTEAGLQLLEGLLAYDPKQRITAHDAMEHRWFKESPLPQQQALMPSFRSAKGGAGVVRQAAPAAAHSPKLPVTLR